LAFISKCGKCAHRYYNNIYIYIIIFYSYNLHVLIIQLRLYSAVQFYNVKHQCFPSCTHLTNIEVRQGYSLGGVPLYRYNIILEKHNLYIHVCTFFFHDKSTRCLLLKFRSLNTNAGPDQTGSCWTSTVVKSTHHHCKSTFSVSI